MEQTNRTQNLFVQRSNSFPMNPEKNALIPSVNDIPVIYVAAYTYRCTDGIEKTDICQAKPPYIFVEF